jgi:hypothetical protein
MWLALLLLLAAEDWKPLDGWKAVDFPRAGAVRVENGELRLEPGAPMTGITWAGFGAKASYEVRFEAARQKGNDFFASLTFPYEESHATWVNGGWGGDIVGVSSIDGWDASENETRTYFTFEPGRYYKFRLEVDAGRIRCHIDDKLVVDLKVNGRTIGLRRGMDVTRPLSLFSYNTGASVRKLEWRAKESR